MFIRLALILACFYASAFSLWADEGEDGGANEPPCEEGGPYYVDNGENGWYCKEPGEYIDDDKSLGITDDNIVIAVGDSPWDPVTGESTFSNSIEERIASYNCPQARTEEETREVSHSGDYEIRIAEGSAEDTPEFNGGSFDEPGTFSYDVFAVTKDSEESSSLCSPEEVRVDSFTVTVVGVASVEGEGESSTTNSPGEDETIYVALGEGGEGPPATITLTAMPDPAGGEGESSWPAGEPSWSGWIDVEEGEGGSDTVEFPIDTISSSAEGTTVRASCGTGDNSSDDPSSKAIKVVVVGVASVQGEGVEFTDENGTVVSTSDADEPEADEIIFVTENDIESTITLTAVSDPSDSVGEGEVESLWPDEEPTWEGATASEGDPAVATVPASEVLEDGFVEVEVSCGASVKKIWLLKVDLEWISKDETNNPIDENPNEGGGKRYFPGKRLPTESSPRNIITLKVSVPGLAGKQVKLKAFDVDDPTDQPAGYDNFDASIIDVNGAIGDDNFNDSQGGKFVSAASTTTTVTLDDDGEAEIDFQVGMQPGNNYRVVATLEDYAGNFDQLQVSDSIATDTFVSPGDRQIAGFTGAGAASPMLTVWRHLWCEFDSMESVENALATSEVNYEWGTIDSITTVGVPSGQSKLDVGQSLVDEENRYEGGFISIFFDGEDHEYEIVSNTDSLFDDDVVILGTPGSIVEGKSFSIYDDDYIMNSSQISPPTHATLPYTLSGGGSNSSGNLIEDAYAVAYIKPMLAPSEYIDTDVSFNRNVDGLIEPFTLMGEIGKDLEDTEDYWAVHLLASWQGDIDKDGDGGDGNSLQQNGISADFYNSGFIYIETIRESEILPFWPRFLEEHVVVHEIGHQGGGDHDDGGIMGEPMQTSEGADSIEGGRFWPITVKRFREDLKF